MGPGGSADFMDALVQVRGGFFSVEEKAIQASKGGCTLVF